jgi:mRNA-degrading endonuclease RelE of RelBE toxin-antitoxin system
LSNYIVLFSDDFENELRKLSSVDVNRVLKKIKMMEINPFYPSLRTTKMEGRSGYYESSVNMDIRLVWKYKDGKIVVMIDVGHHDILRKY